METSKQNNTLKRRDLDGIQIAEFLHGGIAEFMISAACGPAEDFSDFLSRVRSTCVPASASIICQDILGPSVSDRSLTEPDHPLTWIQPLDGNNRHARGTQIWALKGAKVERILRNKRVIGSLFEDDSVRCCRLGGLGTANRNQSRQIQARETFLEMQNLLVQINMDFHNVMRTWFYNDRILDWYDTFNHVRTQYFADHDIVLAEFPASTGIGAPNPSGSALTAGLLAVTPKSPGTFWKTVESPMQENPSEYGSSFSRAAELTAAGYRRLFISGTASISYDGRTIHIGDIHSQIERTMQVVHSILESRNMNWTDVTRALLYFKDPQFLDPWRQWCARQTFSLPLCTAHADICRDDLLFEIELDAVKSK